MWCEATQDEKPPSLPFINTNGCIIAVGYEHHLTNVSANKRKFERPLAPQDKHELTSCKTGFEEPTGKSLPFQEGIEC